jgi:hypothetical protein
MMDRLLRGLMEGPPEEEEVAAWIEAGDLEGVPGLVFAAAGAGWAELLLRHRSEGAAFALQRYAVHLGRHGQVAGIESQHEPPVLVSGHALARLEQRAPHLTPAETARLLWMLSSSLLAIEAWEALPLGSPLDLRVPGGLIAASVEEEGVVVATYIDEKQLRPAQRDMPLPPPPEAALPPGPHRLWLAGMAVKTDARPDDPKTW